MQLRNFQQEWAWYNTKWYSAKSKDLKVAIDLRNLGVLKPDKTSDISVRSLQAYI